jgi:hypothetical protein
MAAKALAPAFSWVSSRVGRVRTIGILETFFGFLGSAGRSTGCAIEAAALPAVPVAACDGSVDGAAAWHWLGCCRHLQQFGAAGGHGCNSVSRPCATPRMGFAQAACRVEKRRRHIAGARLVAGTLWPWSDQGVSAGSGLCRSRRNDHTVGRRSNCCGLGREFVVNRSDHPCRPSIAVAPVRDGKLHRCPNRHPDNYGGHGKPQATSPAWRGTQKPKFGVKVRHGRPVRKRRGHVSISSDTRATFAHVNRQDHAVQRLEGSGRQRFIVVCRSSPIVG